MTDQREKLWPERTRRAYDAVTMVILGNAEFARKWVAISLADGRCDGTLYERKADAVRHQLHEQQCAYLCIPPDGITLQVLDKFLTFNEQLYAMGARLADPAGDPNAQIPMPMNPGVLPYIYQAVKRGR